MPPAPTKAPATLRIIESLSGYWLVYSVSVTDGIEALRLVGTIDPNAPDVAAEARKLAG